jgi:hypothetical protein
MELIQHFVILITIYVVHRGLKISPAVLLTLNYGTISLRGLSCSSAGFEPVSVCSHLGKFGK